MRANQLAGCKSYSALISTNIVMIILALLTCSGSGCPGPMDACSGDPCNDGDFCTTDTCTVDASAADGRICNVIPVNCGDQVCNPTTGDCVDCVEDADCDNGQFCDGEETCFVDNTCSAGSGPCSPDESCDENADICRPPCTTDSDCDNGDFCDGAETCDNDGFCSLGTGPCDPRQTCNEDTDTCEGGLPELTVSISGCPSGSAAVGSTLTLTANVSGTAGDPRLFNWIVTGSSTFASANGTSTIDVTVGAGNTTVTVVVTDFDDLDGSGAFEADIDSFGDEASDQCSFSGEGGDCDQPGTYQPGTPTTRTISINPPGGTLAYGVEDTPPTGWTVSNVSHDGSFDSGNNAVKWFFVDGTSRTLSYTVVPSAGSSGTQCFEANINFDGDDSQTVSACLDEFDCSSTPTPTPTVSPSPTPTPTPTPTPGARLFISNLFGNNVISYTNPRSINGNIAPDTNLAGAQTQLNEPGDVVVNTANTLLVSNFIGNSIASYFNADQTNGNIFPDGNVQGAATLIESPTSTAYYANQDLLFVTDSTPDQILVFQGTTGSFNGNIAPARTIQSADLNDPFGINFGANNDLYVANNGNANILVFANASTLNGNNNATRIITSASFVGARLLDVFVDQDDTMYVVAAHGFIYTFNNALTLSGNVDPDFTLDVPPALAITAIAVDANNTGYIVDNANNAVYSYDNIGTKNGAINPTRTIQGDQTQLFGPFRVFLRE